MERMTSGCYERVVNLLGNGWMAKVHNKEPPVGNIPQVPLNTTRLWHDHKLSAVLTQHDYDSVGGMGGKNDGTRNSHSKCRLTQHNYDKLP